MSRGNPPAVATVAALVLAGLLAPASPARAQGPGAEASPVAAGEAGARPLPRVDAVEVEGATAFTRERLLAMALVRPGDLLAREPAEVAAGLERRYRAAGYPAARVEARFDPATASLCLTIAEGRLRSFRVEGLEGAARARAEAEVALPAGEPLREAALARALDRIEQASGGALRRAGEDPHYVLSPTPEGVDVALLVEPAPSRLAVAPTGPRVAPLMTRVDGFAPWLTVEGQVHDRARYQHARLYAGASYGFASERLGYLVGAWRPFAGGRLLAGYEAHDFTDSDDAFRTVGFERAPAVVAVLPRPQDFFRRRGHEVYLHLRLRPELMAGLNLRLDEHESLPVTSDGSLFRSPEPEPNPPVQGGRMRSVLLSARFARGGPLFLTADHERDAMLARNPFGTRMEGRQSLRAEAVLELASPDLGGDFDFGRLTGDVKLARALASRHTVRLRLLGGAAWGEVPPQRRLALGGPGTLRGYEEKAFLGDAALVLTAEWAVRTARRLPGLVVFHDAGRVFGDASDDRWRLDAGAGLEFPGGGDFLARLDVAVPLVRAGGHRDVRTVLRLRLPVY